MDFIYFLNLFKRRYKLIVCVLLMGIITQALFVYFAETKWTAKLTGRLNMPVFSQAVKDATVALPDLFNADSFNTMVKQDDFLAGWLHRCAAPGDDPAEPPPALRQAMKKTAFTSESNTLSIAFQAPSRVMVTQLTESFAALFPEKLRTLHEKFASAYRKNIRVKLKWLDREIGAARDHLAEAAGKDPLLDKLDSFERELGQAEAAAAKAATQAANLKTLRNDTDQAIKTIESSSTADLMTKDLDDSMFKEFIKKQRWSLLDTQIRILQEKATKTDIHPDLVKLREDMDNTAKVLNAFLNPEGEMFPYVATIYKEARDKAQTEYQNLKNKHGELAHVLARTEKTHQAAERRVAHLKSNQRVYQNNHAHLLTLENRQQALAQAEAELSLLQLHQPGFVNFHLPFDEPENQGVKPATVFYFGLLLSLFISIGVCYLVELLDPRLHDMDQLKMQFNVPILCGLPHTSRQAGRPEPDRFHHLSTVLLQKLLAFKKRPICTVVTAPKHGDGTTLTAEALACAAARTGNKVLLVKQTRSASAFPALKQSCVSLAQARHLEKQALVALSGGRRTFPDFVLLPEDLPDFPLPIIATGVTGLYGLPPLADPQDYQEKDLAWLINKGRECFDVVIIDAPPLERSSWATRLGALADGLVLVLKAGKTNLRQTQALLRDWDGTDIQLYGFVVNCIKNHRKDMMIQEPATMDTAA